MNDRSPSERRGQNAHERLLKDIERLGARVRELEQQLRESDRMASLGHACAAVAHEFNNLLTPALGYTKLALDSPDDVGLSHKALEKAAMSIEKASAISTSLLGIARGDDAAGGVCDVAAALDEAVRCLGRPLSQDGITLERSIEPGLQAQMSSIALEQVFLNLLLNARAALARGQSVGILAARSTWNEGDDGAPCVRIQVKDTGPGLPRRVAQAVFGREAAVGASSGTLVASEGADGRRGLGLSICRRLVEEAAGQIRLESSRNEKPGACFTILLPTPQAGDVKRAA